MKQADLVARRQAELRARVEPHLDAGETLRAALWVARDAGLPMIVKIAPQGLPGMGGSVLSANPQSGLDGPEGSTAADLDRRLPQHPAVAVLALTDARLLLLTVSDALPPEREPAADARPAGFLDHLGRIGRRLFDQGEPVALPLLEPVWRCHRAALHAVGVSGPEGRLALRFTDGSSLAVAAPALLALPFAEAARPDQIA
ncbi:hypothetical protein [Actinoplanes awajinensis]|uniref:Uncharacterized protein n=1 Tax=Actinoplanes awajinensis subsp. mycoplanecinus TaxID=135947 RepID=A0A0X3UR53_9ACTN|nr:hypothetical protein [Actinoplanes awajinensis]KUL34282.1 hypothetical protein ADL15_16750 [Actinoplanes awajinensis subsp. mycoplanecinus]